MKSINLPRGSILQIYATDLSSTGGDGTIKWNKVTEHNRAEFTISPNRIEKTMRMGNGSLRNFFIADKQTMSVSWNMLPSFRTLTVYGAWGAEDLREFYSANQGNSFKIRINYAWSGTSQESTGYTEYNVKLTSFSATVIKRGLQPFWNISMNMEEV